MSFLRKVFAVNKGKTDPDATSTIINLRETENMLIKKQEHLEKKIDLEIKIAKTNGANNKQVAIQALRRKHRYVKQLQQIDGTLATLEMQREALESASTNTAVLESMKTAADSLKKVHNHVDIDQVHNIMEDIEEQQDLAREISDAISNPFGLDVDDVDDLERELEKFEQEALDEEFIETRQLGVDISAPPIAKSLTEEVRENKLAKVLRKKDESEMENLKIWAS